MPKNKGKGGKNYKKGKKRDEGEARRDLLFKEDGQGAFGLPLLVEAPAPDCPRLY